MTRQFQTGNFHNFEQFKIDSQFADFGQVKLTLIVYLYHFWAGQLFY